MAFVRSFTGRRSRRAALAACAGACALAWLFPSWVSAGDALVAPNENLVTDGIPPVPASIADTARLYTEMRSATFQGWHPARRELLVRTRFGNTTQIHLVKVPGGARRQLTFLPERVLGASWPEDPAVADSFVFTSDVGGGEWTQIYRLDVSTGKVTLLTDGRSQNGIGAFAHRGSRLAYESTRRNGQDRDIYVIDVVDPKNDRRVAELQGGGWGVLDWSPDDRTLLVGEGISANESYLWLVDVASGAKTLVTPKGGAERVAYGGARFSRDGKGLYVTTDRESEFQRLAYLDLASGKHTYLTTSIPWDVDNFDLSHDGKTIAFVTNEDGVDVLRLLDTATGREKPGPRLPAGTLGGLAFGPGDRELGFSRASARFPSDVFSLDVASLKLERWTESETGGIDTAAFPEAELVRVKSFDGRTISGFLYRPPARFTGPRPVIVEFHGGPEGQALPDFQGRDSYFLNELGVALLLPNVRGSSGYGKTFLALDNGVKREDAVKDAGALLDWIGTRPDLDAGRVLVTGGSYGGYMTLAVATQYPERLRGAIDEVGISHFVTFLQNTQAYRRDLRRVEYGDERDPETRAFMERTAPLNNAHKITRPLFVVQGKNDPRVPYTEAEQMVATVKKNGTPVWYLMAKDEGHGFSKKPNQDFLFYARVLFVQEYLLK
jgi:dipeptidyl aminopeptidase/acylaminoacyl peptidase